MGEEIVEIPQDVREKEVQRVWKVMLDDIENRMIKKDISKSNVANAIGKKPEVITRSTKLENKPTLETVVQLYMGINRRIVRVVTEEYDFKSGYDEN